MLAVVVIIILNLLQDEGRSQQPSPLSDVSVLHPAVMLSFHISTWFFVCPDSCHRRVVTVFFVVICNQF